VTRIKLTRIWINEEFCISGDEFLSCITKVTRFWASKHSDTHFSLAIVCSFPENCSTQAAGARLGTDTGALPGNCKTNC